MPARTTGHERLASTAKSVKLIAPQWVKPYVKTNKNNAADAEAICQALSRPSMPSVAIKTTAQPALQAIHSIRSELIKQRTGKGYPIRRLLAEYAIAVDKRLERRGAPLPAILEDAVNGLTTGMRELWQDLVKLGERIKQIDETTALERKCDHAVKRLEQILGVGAISATALVAAVGSTGRPSTLAFSRLPRMHKTAK